MAEERTEAARQQSTQAVIDTDDLDNLATPESILLSAVSGEDAQDRSDRTILTPWVCWLTVVFVIKKEAICIWILVLENYVYCCTTTITSSNYV